MLNLIAHARANGVAVPDADSYPLLLFLVPNGAKTASIHKAATRAEEANVKSVPLVASVLATAESGDAESFVKQGGGDAWAAADPALKKDPHVIAAVITEVVDHLRKKNPASDLPADLEVVGDWFKGIAAGNNAELAILNHLTLAIAGMFYPKQGNFRPCTPVGS